MTTPQEPDPDIIPGTSRPIPVDPDTQPIPDPDTQPIPDPGPETEPRPDAESGPEVLGPQ